MEETLQDVRQETQPTSYSKQCRRIIHQASTHVKNKAHKPRAPREIGEIAKLAQEALVKKANSGDPRNLFRNFDEGRNGYVTYDDFNQALLATNINLSKTETLLLAHTLDKDQNGILDYTELSSTLNQMTQKYSSTSLSSSNQQHKEKNHTKRSSNSPPPLPSSTLASPPPPSDPVAEGYRRAYEYGLRFVKTQQENQTLFERNEQKYYESLGPEIEIPYAERVFHQSSLQPARGGEIMTNQRIYHRGCGVLPPTMTDHLKGVLLPSQAGKKQPTHITKRPQTPVVLTGEGGDDHSDNSSSYSDIYLNSRKNRPENQGTGIAKSYNGRHITGAGHISTSVIVGPKGDDPGGPVRSYERAYIGNPTNLSNRSSRDFSNAFIVDQVPPLSIPFPPHLAR
jgi:hypothetical protein